MKPSMPRGNLDPMLRIILLLLLASPAWAVDQGLCYSSLKKTTTQGAGDLYAITDVDQNIRHWLALEASKGIYNLPDLDRQTSGDHFVSQFEFFLNHHVAGYKYYSYDSDRTTGLKFMILEPLNPQEPWIFAFAGTQGTMDVYSDLAMGHEQIRVVEKFVLRMMDCLTIDSQGLPLASHNWLVTGHSLGGGLAQIFAYLSQNLRTLMRFTPGRIELVTFNGFGSLDVAMGGKDFTDKVMPGVLSFNYFVEGDPVSRIGTHLGDTYILPLAGASLLPHELLRRHGIGTVESIVVHGDHVDFSVAKKQAPPYSGPLNGLKGAGKWLGFLAENHRDNLNVQLTQRNELIEAVNFLFQRSLSGSLDKLTLNYIYELSLDLKSDLESLPKSSPRSEIISDLEKLNAAVEKYR